MAAKIHLPPPHPQHFPLRDRNPARRSLLSSSCPCSLLLLGTQKTRCPNHMMGRCGKPATIISRERGSSLVSAQALPLISIDSLTAKLFHMSRPSTVQALLLLGFREFGIGSMEQGWLFIGTFLIFEYRRFIQNVV